MIQKIQIKNYQTHSKFQLNLDPHITTIVGPSDVGKSAVIRALRWVCLNRPLGNHFIKDGTESCAVRVLVGDKEVVRKKGKHNTYTLEGIKYKAFGNSVPSPVENVLNIGDINFQGQHDSSFWFALSAGDVARQLNKIIDLDIIDKSMGFIASELRRNKTLVEVTENKTKQTKDKLDTLDFVEELTDDFDGICALEEKLDLITKEISGLKSVVDKTKQLEEDKESSEELVKNFWTIEELAIISVETSNKYSKLSNTTEELKELEEVVSSKSPDIEQLEKACVAALDTEEIVEDLRKTVSPIAHHMNQIHMHKAKAKELSDKLLTITKGICPICGNELKEI